MAIKKSDLYSSLWASRNVSMRMRQIGFAFSEDP